MYIVRHILSDVHCQTYIVRSTLSDYIVSCTLSDVYCQTYIVSCTLWDVYCDTYIVRCILSNVHCQIYIVKCTLSDVYCQTWLNSKCGLTPWPAKDTEVSWPEAETRRSLVQACCPSGIDRWHSNEGVFGIPAPDCSLPAHIIRWSDLQPTGCSPSLFSCLVWMFFYKECEITNGLHVKSVMLL